MLDFTIIALIILTILYIINLYLMICVVYNKEHPMKIFMPFVSFAMTNVFFLAFATFGLIAMGLGFYIAVAFWMICVAIGFWYNIIQNGDM